MVRKEDSVYLFIGQGPSKDIQIKHLTEEILTKETRDFNTDVAYGRELNLKGLQEKLLFYPLKSQKRLLVIRDAHRLKEEIKLFLLDYLKRCKAGTILILDVDRDDPDDNFLSSIKRHSRVYSFAQDRPGEAFDLVREIERGRSAQSLKILNRLLLEGLRPEFILGALRFVAKHPGSSQDRSITRLLINCDLQIKTGKLRPVFALEKLIVSLCGLSGSGKLAR